MNSTRCFKHLLAIATLVSLCLVLISPQLTSAELQKSERKGAKLHLRFLYLLSDFSGPIPSQWARLAYDQKNNELFTLDPRSHEIRIFNKAGMEIFTFGGQGDIATLRDLAIGGGGIIYGLPQSSIEKTIHVFNYRGKPQEVIPLQGFPEQLSHFKADQLEYRNGKFYLLDSAAMQIVIVAENGTFEQMYDIGTRLRNFQAEKDPEGKALSALDISGFAIDSEENIYFTAPQIFTAFRLSTDETLIPFGKAGSGPGKFGVVSGIAVDEYGIIYITDRLRSVVLLFDNNFQFLGEFGYRGGLPEDLIVPDDIVVDQQGDRVFVAQAANKGVGVYRVIIE